MWLDRRLCERAGSGSRVTFGDALSNKRQRKVSIAAATGESREARTSAHTRAHVLKARSQVVRYTEKIASASAWVAGGTGRSSGTHKSWRGALEARIAS